MVVIRLSDGSWVRCKQRGRPQEKQGVSQKCQLPRRVASMLGEGGVETHPLTRRLPSRRGWVGLLTVRSLGDKPWRTTLRHDRSARAVRHARVCARPARTIQSKKDRHVNFPSLTNALSRKEDKTAPLRAKNDWRLAGSRSSRTRAAPVDGPDDEVEDGEDNEADNDSDGDGNIKVV